MESLQELAELILLVAGSALVLFVVLFRSTPGGRALETDAAAARQRAADSVLGGAPSDNAVRSYHRLLEAALRAGVAIDWDMARRDHTATTGDLQLSLVATARRQLPLS